MYGFPIAADAEAAHLSSGPYPHCAGDAARLAGTSVSFRAEFYPGVYDTLEAAEGAHAEQSRDGRTARIPVPGGWRILYRFWLPSPTPTQVSKSEC